MQCRFRKLCKNGVFHYSGADKCSHEDSWECPMAAKIEDLLMDVADPDHQCPDDEEIPFSEPYDGPEYEGEED